MNVLAIDTATPAVTAGVVRLDGVQVLAERVTVDARAHAEQLTPNAVAALADAGLGVDELDAVVVGCGPGPFTGLRVGMATAAAYGHALGIPVHGVCSLDAIGVDTVGDVLVVTDARRREVYWARYRDGARTDGPAVCAAADVPPGATAAAGAPAHAAPFGLFVLYSSRFTATNELRAAAGRTAASVDVARLRAPAAYPRAIDEVALCLAQQPLHRLQRLPGSNAGDPFLYDDSFLHDQVSRSTLRAHGDAIELKPGVAAGLARLAGLLKPALEIMWVEDVRRMNKFLDAEVPDVAGHLFGRERAVLSAVREPFKDVFGAHCFYCGTHLPANNPIDHVLPWSLVGIDGLSNLVLACAM